MMKGYVGNILNANRYVLKPEEKRHSANDEGESEVEDTGLVGHHDASVTEKFVPTGKGCPFSARRPTAARGRLHLMLFVRKHYALAAAIGLALQVLMKLLLQTIIVVN